MPPADGYRRFAESRLTEALADSPVVLLHGPRQSGKTTLARHVAASAGFAYLTFDDDSTRLSADEDPAGFVARMPAHVVLDEIQRVPQLFTSLKAAVDRDRTPGRFLLTGSANVLLIPSLGDSLAGRMEILRLHPLAQCELAGTPSGFLDALLAGHFPTRPVHRLGADLARRIVAGGYPAALAREPGRRRTAWYRSYLETMVQRDVQELSRITALDALPRLLSLVAAQTARLLNVSGLAGPFEVSRPTIREYLTLLQRVFLVEELSPWHTNRLSRAVKTPKLHIGDTGLAAALLDTDAADLDGSRDLIGQLVETFVYQELRRLAAWHDASLAFFHYRDRDDYEVDIVIEQGGRQVMGVEVKAASTVGRSDFAGLRRLAAAAGDRFVCGVVLYDGEASLGFGDKLFAVPIRLLWEMPPGRERPGPSRTARKASRTAAKTTSRTAPRRTPSASSRKGGRRR